MWDPSIDATCLNSKLAFTVLASLNTFSEFTVAILPIPAVLKLGIDKKQRWAVISLLSLGLFVTVVGCIRTYFVWLIFASYDATWWVEPQWICSEVEVDTALVSQADITAPCFRMPLWSSWSISLIRSLLADMRLRSSTPSLRGSPPVSPPKRSISISSAPCCRRLTQRPSFRGQVQ
jgi:hypothetical protein